MDFDQITAITNPVKAGFFVLLLCGFLISSCNLGSNKVSYSAVVKVNEHELNAKEFSELLARQLKSLDSLSAKDPNNLQRLKEEIVRNFILQSILVDYAKVLKIEVTSQEVDQEVNSIRSSYPDDLAFRRVLAQEELSLSDWKKSLASSLLTKKVFAKIGEKIQKPTEQEIKKYFDENKDRFRRKERILLRQIVTDDLTKAQSIRDELNKNADFVQLANKYSVAPEGKSGGLVGWVEKGSVDIFDKAFSLSLGATGPVLESSYGFHIFKVERKSPAGVISIDEARAQIVQFLLAQKEQAEFRGWLDKQIRQSRVLKNVELINNVYVETKGKK